MNLPNLPLDVSDQISLVIQVLFKCTFQVQILYLRDFLDVKRDLTSFERALIQGAWPSIVETCIFRDLIVDMDWASQVKRWLVLFVLNLSRLIRPMLGVLVIRESCIVLLTVRWGQNILLNVFELVSLRSLSFLILESTSELLAVGCINVFKVDRVGHCKSHIQIINLLLKLYHSCRGEYSVLVFPSRRWIALVKIGWAARGAGLLSHQHWLGLAAKIRVLLHFQNLN